MLPQKIKRAGTRNINFFLLGLSRLWRREWGHKNISEHFRRLPRKIQRFCNFRLIQHLIQTWHILLLESNLLDFSRDFRATFGKLRAWHHPHPHISTEHRFLSPPPWLKRHEQEVMGLVPTQTIKNNGDHWVVNHSA